MTAKSRLIPSLAALLVALSLSGQTPAPKKTKTRSRTVPAPARASGAGPRIEFEKYTLPNGLQVILHVDRKLPIVHVNEWFHVGSKNEKPGRTGFAHLFEHEMFEGSKNAPGKYWARMELAGANVSEGGVNGTTNNDRTNYFTTVPSGSLEYALWIESDRLATLGQHLTKENLDAQRAVVKNERRQGLENQPYGRAFDLIAQNLFPAGHPYSWSVIGSQEDLSAASLEDVQEFFARYYAPNNLSLVIAGDFDPAAAKKLVEKYFGDIPPGPPLDRPERWIPELPGEKIVEAADRVAQERVYMVWPSPEGYAPGDAELDLASFILADGLSSRLQKVLVHDRELCTAVNSFQSSQEISGFYAVIATARPGAPLPLIEKIVTEEIAKLARQGPTPAELARAKTKWEYSFVSGLERIGGFGGKADRLNSYNTYLGDPGKFDFDRDRYQNATAQDVRKAVARWLDTSHRLLVRFHPEKSGRVAEAASGPLQAARPRRRHAVPRAGGPVGDPSQRARGPGGRAARSAQGGRHAGFPRGLDGRSAREGRNRLPDRRDAQPGHEDPQGPGDRVGVRRPRHVSGHPDAEGERPARIRGLEAQSRPGPAAPGRRRARPDLSRDGGRAGEEAALGRARPAGEERQRGLPRACGRCCSSVEPILMAARCRVFPRPSRA